MLENKKVLIVTYYWPPAGGPGVQRWLKFAKYLPEFGWEPIIYTPKNPSYPILDETLSSEVSPNLQVIKTKIWEPYQLAEKLTKKNKKFRAGQFDTDAHQSWKSKLSIWIRGNFFIPDARVFWVNPSIKYLRKYLSEHHIDTLVTTGPPHSLHLIGLGLKKIFPHLKWVADFRDPWTEISYYQHLRLTKKSDEKHRFLEKQVFEKADITLATSFTDAENFRNKGANSVCITNGFDGNEMNKYPVKTKDSDRFVLSYIGVLEQLRNPINLWDVLNEMIAEDKNFASDFRLKFVGRVDENILSEIKKTVLIENTDNLGYLAHDKSINEMQNSDVLLITNFPKANSKGIIPGKLFEYLASKKTILSFGPEMSDVEKIIEETHSGKHFSYRDKEKVKLFILEKYKCWKNNNAEIVKPSIEQYSRRHLTEKLSHIL